MTMTLTLKAELTQESIDVLKSALAIPPPKKSIPEDLITITEAEKLNISPKVIRRFVESGELTDYDPGKLIKFSQSEYVALCYKKQQENINKRKA